MVKRFVRKEVPVIIKKFTLAQISNSSILEPINNDEDISKFKICRYRLYEFETLKQK